MPAPYDYSIGENIASPQQSFLQGIQMVDALRKREQDQAAAIEAKRKEAELQALYAEALQPGAKPEVFQRLNFAIDPKGAALSRMQQLNDAQQDAMIGNMGSVLAPFVAGNPDLAIQRADELIKGMENSPNPDPKSLQALKASRQVFSQSPELAQVNLITSMMGLGEKGRKAVNDIFEAMKKPVEQREAAAKAKKADADAIIAEAQAKFAPDKFGAELNLTNEQIAAAKSARRASEAAASASGAAAKRANAEAEQISSGIIPAEKRQDAETKFRKEYSDQTKGYQEVKSAYGRVLASEDNAVGDLSLIFGYMKMLDPGSVVREGEFATAQNAAGVPERIKNVYNQVISGERLSESQRSAFKGQAKKLYGTSQQQEAQVRQGISRIAKGYGLNTQNIFYTASEVEPIAPKESTPSAQPSNYQNMSDAELMKMLGR
jgi:hypothetical protein